MKDNKFENFNDFKAFLQGLNTNPIPLEFTQALTTTEFLHILLKYVKDICDSSDELNNRIYNEFSKKFDELKTQILNDDAYYNNAVNKLKDFCILHINELIGDSLKYITFGLDDDGYFCAYIPYNFKFLTFDTDVNTESENYGKLQLIY